MKKTIKKAENGKRIRGTYTPSKEAQANRDQQAAKAVSIVKSTQPRTDAAGMQYFGKQVANAMNSPEYKKPESKQPEERVGPIKRAGSSSSAPKSTGSGGTKTSGSKGGGAKRKPVRTTSVGYSLGKNKMPSSTIRNDKDSRPSVPGIQSRPERTEFSKRESKIAAQVQKMKSGKTSTEAGQARIASLQAREKMAKQKAMRKEKRAAVKAVKQSYK